MIIWGESRQLFREVLVELELSENFGTVWTIHLPVSVSLVMRWRVLDDLEHGRISAIFEHMHAALDASATRGLDHHNFTIVCLDLSSFFRSAGDSCFSLIF